MVKSLSASLAAAVVLLIAGVSADDSVPSCGVGQPACPEKYPCCSVEGTCGNGYVCLGGCDARFSYEPGACVAMPVCQSQTYNFTGTNGIASFSEYMGDASKQPWSYLGNITNGDGNTVRTQLFEGTQGSSVSSSNYIWYGKIDIVAKTAGTAGVVTDAILLSNVKDELDWEFVGAGTTTPQTNYYWQAATGNQNEIDAHTSATDQSYHTYTLDWQEDQVTWYIDGQQQRQLKKSDTLNTTSNVYEYPQTPARIQFGIWPAGDSQAEGTRQWSGGSIDWSSSAYTDTGYFYLEVASISVQCYDAPQGTQQNGTSSYVYTNSQALENQVALTDDSTILGSTDGTGLNLNGSLANSQQSSSSRAAAFTLSGAQQQTTTTKGAGLTLTGASQSTTSSKSEITLKSSETPTTSKSTSDSASTSSGSSSSSSSSGSTSGSGSGQNGGSDSSNSSSSDSSSDASATTSGSESSASSTGDSSSNSASASSSSPIESSSSSTSKTSNDGLALLAAPFAAAAPVLLALF